MDFIKLNFIKLNFIKLNFIKTPSRFVARCFIVTALSAALLGSCLLSSCTAAKPQLTLGSLKDGIYDNAYFGFMMDIPPDWHVATREEIDQINQVGDDPTISSASSLLDSPAPEDLAKQKLLSMLYVFKNDFNAVQAGDTNAGLQVVAENLSVAGNTETTEADYLSSIERQIKNVGYVSEPLSSRNFGKAQFTELRASGTQNNLDMEFYCKKIGDYILTVITTCPQADGDAKAALEQSVGSISLTNTK